MDRRSGNHGEAMTTASDQTTDQKGWGGLTAKDAKRMPGYFAEGAGDPIAAKLWGSEIGDPHGMNDGEMANVFEGLSHDELSGVVVFAGPIEHVRSFVLDAQKWIDGAWRDLGESEGGVDCAALCVWDDGRGWAAAGYFRSADVDWNLDGGPGETRRELTKLAEKSRSAAGCGHVGEFGVADSAAESIEEDGEEPAEVAEAMLLMMGERQLAKMVAGIQAGKRSHHPVADAIALRIMAKREALDIGAATGPASGPARPKPL
jgi:hypothetical protein